MVRLEALRGSNVYVADARFAGDVTDFFGRRKLVQIKIRVAQIALRSVEFDLPDIVNISTTIS
jgi:hypothetical protein